MIKSQTELWYLACPYSHKDKRVMRKRFREANRAAAKLMGSGHYVFSPISHTHPIAEAGELPRDWEFWAGYDTAIISRCTKMIVLTIDGWEESIGVQSEIKLAKKFCIPIEYT